MVRLRNLWPLLFGTLMLLCAGGCSGAEHDFSGRFRGDGLTVEMKKDAATGGYSGTFDLQGKRYRVEAHSAGEGLAGEFSGQEGAFAFTIEATDRGVRLETGGTVYRLKRQEAANPLAGRNEKANPLARQDAGGDRRPESESESESESEADAKVNELVEAPAFGQTFKHPSGIYFMYPDRWKAAKTSDSAVALTPDDVFEVDGQPGELMLVFGEEADDVKQLGDPRVIRYYDQFVTGTFPYLRREGAPRTFQVADRKAIEMKWRGTYSGRNMVAYLQATLLSGYGMGTFALSPEDHIEGRRSAMAGVFRTFGYEKPKSDPRLVGTWRYSKTYFSGTFSGTTERDLVLRPDGVCLEGGRMFAGMEHQDATGEATGSTTASSGSGGAEYRGRWHSEGSDIVLEWDNAATERWHFYIEGGSMLWRDGSTKKLWTRVR